MLDDLAASAGSGDAVTWRAKAELAQHDVVQLRAQLRARELEHQPVLERAIAERDTALDRGVELAKEMDQVRLIARASEGQLSRLSGALQLHVAEAEELASKLSDAHRRLGASIDRQVARSWVVNFVENYAGASRSPTASQASAGATFSIARRRASRLTLATAAGVETRSRRRRRGWTVWRLDRRDKSYTSTTFRTVRR
mmetsp:Transcript_16935/g.42304  ORF Transcript_16935/g.42304 Transcript_16935/m.42304 type:complete len:199 (-) Transcript_16935:8-604(-)